MSIIKCPVCSNELFLCENKSFKCENGHNFDMSKYGYTNLLMSSKSSKKRHGDDKTMICARAEFLEKGYYKPLSEKVCELALKFAPSASAVLDCGCGECYYTEGLKQALPSAEFVGIDISKDALRFGFRRMKDIRLFVASIFSLPIKDESCGLVVNMFAPMCEGEFYRVLESGGILLRVFPLENHLLSLKEKIYDEVYLNKIDTLEVAGFEPIATEKLCYKIRLESGADIENLFKMTPYYYKTSATDQQKVKGLTSLETEVEFMLAVYKKA